MIMRKRVILIQDNIDCTEIMRLILEEEGFEVLCPESNQEINGSTYYDLLIIDEFSKGKTGCEICRKLKNSGESFNKPIVLTSTGIGLDTFTKDCSADIYLPKPFDIYTFTRLIRKLLNSN
jgi:DNA-binding response OmpR family regulator